jgi:hypothetical protein
VIHDYEWSGISDTNKVVAEEWKLFPGPLFHQFRDRFFGHASSTRNALDWIRNEYREDVQTRVADQRLHPNIVDAFWCSNLFEDFCMGNWGFTHPLQQEDVDRHFTVFAFILSVAKDATWPPRIPVDGLSIETMMQLGKNVL